MRYVLDHTVLFDLNPWHLIWVALMLLIVWICYRKLRKLRDIRDSLKHEITSEGAEVALEAVPEELSTDELNADRQVAADSRV